MDSYIKESPKLELSQRLAARSLSLMPPLHKIPPKLFRPLFLVMERMLGLRKIDLPHVVDYLIPITLNDTEESVIKDKIKIRVYYPNSNLDQYPSSESISKPDINSDQIDLSEQRSLVYFHGGGCVIGSIETHDHFCRYLAKHSNMNIISVDYRLAPEHKFPAPICDAIVAWNWINKHHKQLHLNREYIGVGGDSAGGYLACLIGQTSLQDTLPIKSKNQPYFQFLLYPMLDLQGLSESYHKFNKYLILTNKLMNYFRGHYLPSLKDLDKPLISPLQNGSLDISPNTYILTLGYDPLRDDGITYVERLKDTGIEVSHDHFPDCMHAFISVAAISKRAKEASHTVALALEKFNRK